ncbi:MAG: phenylalanyl-tRNA synthetase subunit beta [Paracoccaceae bacterium]|nr:phenylalanyl-tRNA synthetase subunit beta [Paracoccaceae bacterium]
MNRQKKTTGIAPRVILVAVMVCFILVAHVFMWLSDMPRNMKIVFTILNAAGWTIVLVPILLVDKWLDAIRDRNSDT